MRGLRKKRGNSLAHRIVADGDFEGQLDFLSFKLKRNHKAPFAPRTSRLEGGLCSERNRVCLVHGPVWGLEPRAASSLQWA